VAGHSGWYRGQVIVQCTHVPASVHKFRSQPDCLADTDLERESGVYAKGTGCFTSKGMPERIISIAATY